MTVDDVAKRLIDYGFHAPTMSFPVAGTLMIEPTESEDRGRARPLLRRDDRDPRRDRPRSSAGEWPADDNPLVHAPHTADDVTSDDVDARVLARAGRVPGRRRCGTRKYWPPVGRIDSAYGDRNVFCSLPAARGLRGLARVGARVSRCDYCALDRASARPEEDTWRHGVPAALRHA